MTCGRESLFELIGVHRPDKETSQNPLTEENLTIKRYIQEIDHYRAFLVCDQHTEPSEKRSSSSVVQDSSQTHNLGIQNQTQGRKSSYLLYLKPVSHTVEGKPKIWEGMDTVLYWQDSLRRLWLCLRFTTVISEPNNRMRFTDFFLFDTDFMISLWPTQSK